MDLTLQSSWHRFHEMTREELHSVRHCLHDLVEQRFDSPQIDYAISQLREMGVGLRGMGLSEAARFAEQAADYLSNPDPRAEVLSRWLLWLECELQRHSQFPKSNLVGLRPLWLSSTSASFGDELALVARIWGWEVRGLNDQSQPLAGQPIVVARDFPGSLTQLEELRPKFPGCPLVAMLTPLSFQDRLALSLAGADLVLPLTGSLEILFEQLEALQARGQQRGSRVLLVEDDRVTQLVLKKILNDGGYQVECIDRVSRFSEYLENFRPEVVILDYQLADGLGTELCLTVRSDPRWNALPLLFLTSSREREVVEELFRAGADDYLTKPVDGPDLLGRLRNRLARARQLRLQGDVDPSCGLVGRFQVVQQIQLLLKLARRHQLSTTIILVQARKGSLMELAARLKAGLRRPGDLMGRFNEDTLLLGFYDTSRSQGLEVIKRLLSGGREGVSAAVAAVPADAYDWVTLLTPLQEALKECPEGELVALGQAGRNQSLHLALLGATERMQEWSRLWLGRHRVECISRFEQLSQCLARPDWNPRILLEWSWLEGRAAEWLPQLASRSSRVVVMQSENDGNALAALELGATQVLAPGISLAQLEASLLV